MIKRCNYIGHEPFDDYQVAERKKSLVPEAVIEIDHLPDRHTKTLDGDGCIKENGRLWEGELGDGEEGGPTMRSARCGQ
jgi:hypothetical protein